MIALGTSIGSNIDDGGHMSYLPYLDDGGHMSYLPYLDDGGHMSYLPYLTLAWYEYHCAFKKIVKAIAGDSREIYLLSASLLVIIL